MREPHRCIYRDTDDAACTVFCVLHCTFMESTAQVWVAVSLALTRGAGLSFSSIVTALTPCT